MTFVFRLDSPEYSIQCTESAARYQVGEKGARCDRRGATFAAGGDPPAAVVPQQVQRVHAAAHRINLNTLAISIILALSKCLG